MHSRSILVAVLVAAALAGCGTAAGPPRTPALAAPPRTIAWRPFGDEAFEEARRTGRLVLVDVGIEGCTACRWMHDDTYRSPAVIARIERDFVPVSVDADVRPDLGARWEPWGWPATIFLTPDGESIRALRGNRRPERFLVALSDVVAAARAGSAPDPAAAVGLEPPEPARVAATCTAAARRVAALGSVEHGGFGGGGVQHVGAEALRYAFFRAATRGEPRFRALALRTAEGYARLVDPIWGGVFVAARRPDWSEPIVEKRTDHEAAALWAFAQAYALTGEARWLDAARDVDRYLRDFLRAPDGTYYSTQQDLAPALPRGMTASDYYRLDDAGRRRFGIPPIDHAAYTDQTARVAVAYAALHRAAGDAEALEASRRAVDALLAGRLTPEGWMLQAGRAPSGDRRMRRFESDGRLYLRPQGAFGLALLALHDETQEARYLEHAVRLAAVVRERLVDREAGGFVAVAEPRSAFERDAPVLENLETARFLVALAHRRRHHDEEAAAYRDVARAAVLRVLGARPDLERWGVAAGSIAYVLDALELGPVEVAIAASPDDPGASALLAAARGVANPRIVAGFDADGAYPRSMGASAFVCTDSACSSPIADPAVLARRVVEAATIEADACPP